MATEPLVRQLAKALADELDAAQGVARRVDLASRAQDDMRNGLSQFP
jgi:hypothetical protein